MTVKYSIDKDITKGWETAEEYLSGYVVDKLAEAEAFAKEDDSYLENVRALKEVQPPKLEASDIEINLGATWIPEEYITQFAKETLKIKDSYYARYNMEITYNKNLSKWIVENKGWNSNIENTQIYGTKRIEGIDLLENTLNLKHTTIYDPDPKDPEGKKRIVNRQETILAREKQEALKERFKNIVLLYDSDLTGVRFMNKIRKQYRDLIVCMIPRKYEAKDISDFYQKYGRNKTIEVIKEYINYIKREKKIA